MEHGASHTRAVHMATALVREVAEQKEATISSLSGPT